MKKKIITVLISLCVFLSGCSNPFVEYREIEHLLVIQTMGIDAENGRVRLSLASSSDISDGVPKRLMASGSSVTMAMERIYDYSYEEELFCYHVRSVLIGEKAAEAGIEDYLAYICRSPIMRVDVPVYIVKGHDASSLIADVGDGSRGIAEVMQNISSRLSRRGSEQGFTSADVLRNLKRFGSSLICALDYSDSTESDSSGKELSGKTAAFSGYAVIRDGKLCKFIGEDEAAAAEIIMGRCGVYDIEVSDGLGAKVTLEINSGSADISPVWSPSGELQGISLHLDAQYSVLETNGRSDLENAEYADRLTAALESELLSRASSVLDTSAQLKADFLGLAAYVERSVPEYRLSLSRDFADMLPSLDFQLSVSCRMMHTNDMKDI